jgi:hypothetical protein
MERSFQVELPGKSKGKAVHCYGKSWKKVEIHTFEIRAYLTNTRGRWQSVKVHLRVLQPCSSHVCHIVV